MSGKTSTASKNKWNKNNYDRIQITVPKGERERIKDYADNKGETVNGFIKRVIYEAMESDS